ncbi:MAG: sporulation protein YabP [Clostridiales bacterium]|nr:sporulation protein YabP [Clostridiales bacterium]MDY3746519.1 sporulation protein YabP [Lachnospiraceae bacterium]
MEEQRISQSHQMMLNDRRSIEVTGVIDVVSFDAEEIILETSCGLLLIRGSDLHMNRLTLEKGEVNVDGSIDGLTYSDAAGAGKKAGHFLGRLFG